MRFSALLSLLVLLFSTCQIYGQCGSKLTDRYVGKVIFERPGVLTPEQEASIRTKLIGKCFAESDVGPLGEVVYRRFRDLGFLRAAVQDPIVRAGDNGDPRAATLVVDVEQGPRYVIKTVIWAGVHSLSSEELRDRSTVRPGEILDVNKVRQTTDAVKELYAANGFPNVTVSSSFETKDNHVLLTFRITEGQRIH